MLIRKTTPADIETVMEIYERARLRMAKEGNPTQWGNNHPPQSLIEEDIKNGFSYVCIEDDTIVGVFYYAVGNDPTYTIIEDGHWLSDAPYGVIHRIAIDVPYKGYAKKAIDWCFANHSNLRIDTHEDNKVMQRALQKNGFTYCGIIYVADGSKRLAFQRDGLRS